MKLKNIYLIVVMALVFGACNDDIEIWDSATIDYAGTYVYELQSEDGSAVYRGYSDTRKLEIYNTANDVANEVWMDDHEKLFPLKSKFFLSGDAMSFASVSMEFDNLTNNLPSVEIPDDAPVAADVTFVEARDYIRCAIEEGKILTNAATSVGGNQTDSIYFKIRLLSGQVTFKSYSVPVEQRQNPDKEEFAWEYISASYDNTKDEVYIISGHRYTGFPEDHY
jgi:hypothetical protein